MTPEGLEAPSDAKAQEVLALLKPMVKDLEARKQDFLAGKAFKGGGLAALAYPHAELGAESHATTSRPRMKPGTAGTAFPSW